MFKIIVVLLTVVFNTTGNILLKIGTQSFGNLASLSLSGKIVALLTNPALIGGILAYGIGMIFFILSLSKIPVSVAYPMVSLGYVTVMIASYFFLKEPITAYKVLGIAIIFVGIFFLIREA